MRVFVGQDSFSGNYEQDLERTLNILETLAEIFYSTPQEMRRAIPVMFKEKDLKFFHQGHRRQRHVNQRRIRRYLHWNEEKYKKLFTEWMEKLAYAMESIKDSSDI